MIVTPGTRIQFHDVGTWVDGYMELHQRPASAQRYAQLDAHVEALATDLIRRERSAGALQRLRTVFQAPGTRLKPPRGMRAGSHYERVITHTNNRLMALARSPLPLTPEEAYAAAEARGMTFSLFEGAAP